MLKSTLEGRIFFFACSFLWNALALFHHLDEEVAKQRIGSFYLKRWGTPFANLTHWTLEERDLPVHFHENLTRSEVDLLFSKVETLGSSLIAHLANELNDAAIKTHKQYPRIVGCIIITTAFSNEC